LHYLSRSSVHIVCCSVVISYKHIIIKYILVFITTCHEIMRIYSSDENCTSSQWDLGQYWSQQKNAALAIGLKVKYKIFFFNKVSIVILVVLYSITHQNSYIYWLLWNLFVYLFKNVIKLMRLKYNSSFNHD